MSLVTLDNEGVLAVITLDNPPQNRIGERMAEELGVAIEAVEAGDFRAVLLRAKGPDFSFGGDIVDWPDMSIRRLRTTFETYMTVFNRFERLPVPVIAAVQGLCFGGGLELAIRADMIVAAESARFGHGTDARDRDYAGRYLPRRGTGRTLVRVRVGPYLTTDSRDEHDAAWRRKSGCVRRGAGSERTGTGSPGGTWSDSGLRSSQGAFEDLGGSGCRRCRHGHV
jgi:hypothetical protein